MTSLINLTGNDREDFNNLTQSIKDQYKIPALSYRDYLMVEKCIESCSKDTQVMETGNVEKQLQTCVRLIEILDQKYSDLTLTTILTNKLNDMYLRYRSIS